MTKYGVPVITHPVSYLTMVTYKLITEETITFIDLERKIQPCFLLRSINHENGKTANVSRLLFVLFSMLLVNCEQLKMWHFYD